MRSSLLLLVASTLFIVSTSQAQDRFCRVWYTEGGESKVQIYLAADGVTYQGKIVWLKNGYVSGRALIDTKNPDEAKRRQPWLGLQIINGLVKKSETEIVSGKIYDPSHGNYYSCKMTLKDPNKLELRGYIMGLPFLGRTTTWYLAEEEKKPTPPVKAASAPSGGKENIVN